MQARNISLLSAAGLSCIRTSLDRTASGTGAPTALTGDPSIDFAPAAAIHNLAPMSSFVSDGATAATCGTVRMAGSGARRAASEAPSNLTDESSLDDTSDEDDAASHQKHASAPAVVHADIGAQAGAPGRRRSQHARHASFQAWAGSYAGLASRGGDGGGSGGSGGDDVVMASSPHAECMQIGAGAMHDEEVRTEMKAAALVEALEATGLQDGDVGGDRGTGAPAAGISSGGEERVDEGAEMGTRLSSGDGGAPGAVTHMAASTALFGLLVCLLCMSYWLVCTMIHRLIVRLLSSESAPEPKPLVKLWALNCSSVHVGRCATGGYVWRQC